MKFQGAHFIALLVFLYAILSPPFIFSAFTPFFVRAALELGLLFIILVYLIEVIKCPLPYTAIIIWLMLFVMTLLYSYDEISSLVASTINIVIFILIMKIGNKSDFFIVELRWYWLRIWSLASASIILAFVTYQLDLITFSPFDLGQIIGRDSYNYYNNLLLGNLVQYQFFDFKVPKLSWHIFEPGILSFFLGVNFFIAEKICAKSKSIVLFKAINLMAGLLTFSTTFYVFFVIYAAFKFAMFRSFQKFRLLLAPLLVVTTLTLGYDFFILSDLASFTSIDDRSLRFEIAQSILDKNSIYSFLFGNGIGISGVVSDRGVASGLLSILIERGVLILLFLMFFIYKFTRHSWPLLIYIFFFHLAFELIWYPLFYIAIALNLCPINSTKISYQTVPNNI